MENSFNGNPYYATGAGGNAAPPVVVQGQLVGKTSPEVVSVEEVTKGERQPKRCNDSFWSLLYYLHLALMAYLAIQNGPQMAQTVAGGYMDNFNQRKLDTSLSLRLQGQPPQWMGQMRSLSLATRRIVNNKLKSTAPYLRLHSRHLAENDNNEELEVNPQDVMTLLSITGFVGIGLSTVSLTIIMYYPETLIKMALFFNIGMSALIALTGLAAVQPGLLIMGIFYLLFSIWYACAIWKRIPFAAENLRTAVTSLKSNLMGLAFIAYTSLVCLFLWSIWWALSFMSTMFVLGDCDAQGQCQNESNGFIVFLFLLSYHWVFQVLKNVVHVTVAGTVGTWWFIPEEASSCCSSGVRESFVRSISFSFGSICLGSLIVAIIQAIRDIVRSARDNDDGILFCLADCLLGFIESIIEYFNEWAFVYVGIYGYSFMDAAKGVISLFKSRGWTTIITDSIIGNVLLMNSVGVGVLTGIIGALVANASGMNLEIGGFVFGFIIGFTLTQVLMGLLGSAVNAVIVCYAEDPNAFQANHAELSDKMRNAWRQAWPSEFSY